MKTNTFILEPDFFPPDPPTPPKPDPPPTPKPEEVKSLSLPQDIQDELDKIIQEIAKLPPINGDILNRIMRLIMQLLPSLQYLGTVQANQLEFPTAMQRLYTDLIAKAPIYTSDGANGTTLVADAATRDQMNETTRIHTEKLRGYRDTWSDIAKKQQSHLNITNEAVNQQTDLLTTFLQQLRELVSLITR